MYEFIFPAGFSSDYNENTKKKKIDFLLIFFSFSVLVSQKTWKVLGKKEADIMTDT